MATSSRFTADEALSLIESERLIAIVRARTAEEAFWSASIALDCGFRMLEMTWTTPDAPDVIRQLCAHAPHACIGAGTVLTSEQARQSLNAGARFLVSPVLDETLVRFGVEENILTVPGVMTPTEAHQAIRWGAKALKLFPAAAVGGPVFIQALKGPFPDVKIISTGGLAREDIVPYLKGGGLAVGIGSPLFPEAWVRSRNEADLKRHMQAYLSERDSAKSPTNAGR